MIFLNFDSSIHIHVRWSTYSDILRQIFGLYDGINMLRLHIFFDKAGYDREACRADVDL